VHQGEMNQRIQMAAAELLGAGATAWAASEGMPYFVHGMLRSRANTIEGGTSEVNRNVLGERVLGLPREPDPYQNAAWKDVPRS
jgi:alkylation response protein AidB-like acyl-CoA dehydrogenase